MKRLFVSYSRANKAAVDELTRRLPNLGYQPWVDSSLHGGQSWWEEILRQLAECDAFIAVVSRDSLNSVACQRELEWALALGKPVLPVAVEHLIQALPSEISRRQIVDYSEPGQDAAYALFGALTALPPAPPPPEVLPEPPAAPLSYLTELVDRVARAAPLTHDEQRQIVNQLQPALRSADPEEQQGAQYVLDRFSRRDDLYADVGRMLAQVMRLEDQDTDKQSPSIPQEPTARRYTAPPQETITAKGPTPARDTTAPRKPYPSHPAHPQPIPPAHLSHPLPVPPAHLSHPLPVHTPPQRRRTGLILALVAVIVVASGGIGAWFLLRDRGGTPGPVGALEGQPIAVGKVPYDIEKGDGFVWTTNTGETTISKIDPATGTAEQIEVGGVPAELVVTPGAVWVWNYTDAVTRVSIATGNADDPIPAGAAAIAGIAAGGGYVWLSHTDNTVTRIDMNTRALTGDPIPVGQAPVSMAFANDFVYVVNTGDRTISTISTTGTVLGDPLKLDDELGGIEVVDGTIYVGTTNDVTLIDELSFTVGEPIPLKGGSSFLPDDEGIWVIFPTTNELRWFDHTGAEARGGPITGIGRGINDMVLLDATLWLVDGPGNSVVRVKVR